MLSVVPVIFSAMNESTTVALLCRSRKSGHETSLKPEVPRVVPARTNNLSWSLTSGKGRKRTPSIQPKTAALAPIPRVRQRIASSDTPGLRQHAEPKKEVSGEMLRPLELPRLPGGFPHLGHGAELQARLAYGLRVRCARLLQLGGSRLDVKPDFLVHLALE